MQPGGKNDRGCLAASAHRQVIDYYENRNGLASGARDDGPRQFVGTTWESYTAANRPQPPPPPKRRRTTDMILIRADDSKSVALYGMTGLAGIANPDDLAQIRKALTDPAHTAVVSRGTWDMLAEAVRKP